MVTLIAYQLRGDHSSNRRGTFWRPFQLSKINSIYVSQDVFTPRVRQGYETVIELIRGDTIAVVDVKPSEYFFHHRGIQGPRHRFGKSGTLSAAVDVKVANAS